MKTLNININIKNYNKKKEEANAMVYTVSAFTGLNFNHEIDAITFNKEMAVVKKAEERKEIAYDKEITCIIVTKHDADSFDSYDSYDYSHTQYNPNPAKKKDEEKADVDALKKEVARLKKENEEIKDYSYTWEKEANILKSIICDELKQVGRVPPADLITEESLYDILSSVVNNGDIAERAYCNIAEQYDLPNQENYY